MWSLYEIDKSGEEGEHKKLDPLVFSNGKSQEDVVKEVLDAVNEGHKIIFIHGICGTGKSAIALNIAKELGKTSIVVPGKNLQAQYKKDYEKEKYLLKKDGSKMKISVLTGRGNHKCKFLEDNEAAVPKIRTEVNANLNDIFEFDEETARKKELRDYSADKWDLPCKIEIKEKNWGKLKKYIQQNKHVDPTKFSEIREISRAAVGRVCPYWSPVVPAKFELKSFPDSKKQTYLGLNDTKFIIHQAKPGCAFYEQFNSYVNSDVIVFNSLKYILESALNRKPATEVEIIDECDDFLDKFSSQKTINIDRLQNALIHTIGMTDKADKTIKEASAIVKQIKIDESIQDAIAGKDILELKKTHIFDLIKLFLDCDELLEELDEESYLFEVEEAARMFENFTDDAFVTYSHKDKQILANIVTTNLAKRFKEMVDKNKLFILMSGTLHSEYVLQKIFGLNNFKVIEAETEQQGQINTKRTGTEKDCKYANFYNGQHTRREYLESLDKIIDVAKKPVLVHVNAFSDLPNEMEKQELGLRNLLSREKLKEGQIEDKEGKIVDEFKAGKTDVLFSTRAARGIDFPGEQCNSIVFTKYPNPNAKDPFWLILNRTNPNDYWNFYKDKARRELLQKVYRGVRFKEDKVEVLSPDTRVLDAFEKKD